MLAESADTATITGDYSAPTLLTAISRSQRSAFQRGPTKPKVLAVQPANIPVELKREKRWVVWTCVHKKGKWEKVLKYVATLPDGKKKRRSAATNNPETWMTFEDALAAYERWPDKFDGIGFVLGDGWAGVDADACRDAESGRITPLAMQLLKKLGTYTEVSPSGTGVKAIGRTTDESLKPKRKDNELDAVTYISQYFTMTGVISGLPGDGVTDITEGLRWFEGECQKIAPTKRRNEFVSATSHNHDGDSATDRESFYDSVIENARGKCKEILLALTDLTDRELDQRGSDVPCVYCGGDSRFFTLKHDGGVDEHGQVACRGVDCPLRYLSGDESRPAEGEATANVIDTVSRLCRISFLDAANRIAVLLDMTPFIEDPLGDIGVQERLIAIDIAEQKKSKVETTSVVATTAAEKKPEIKLQHDRSLAVLPALHALAHDPPTRESVYVRDYCLVEITHDDKIRELPIEQIEMRLDGACRWFAPYRSKGGTVYRETSTPTKVVGYVATLGDYRGIVPALKAVVTAPTIRPDGSILQVEGYDHPTKLYYRPSLAFEQIPNSPTPEEARKSAASLLELFSEFPFVSPSDRAAMIAMVVTMVVRHCIPGCVPVFGTSANAPGCGKGTCNELAWIIAYGVGASVTSMPENETELRKTINMEVKAATACLLLDNITEPVGGSTLEAYATAIQWRARELGGNNAIAGEATMIITANGNNLRYKGDMARRVLPIRMQSPAEDPADRDFTIPDIIGHARQNRGKYLRDILTIVAGYYAAGCPQDKPLPNWGGFLEWSRIVRGSLVWAGLPDPIGTRESAKSDDSSLVMLSGLIAGLIEIDPERNGLTSQEIIDAACESEMTRHERCTLMREAIGMMGGKVDARRMGNQLAKLRGRIDNGQRIVGRDAGSRRLKWTVENI